jgi:hypothetical protein
MAEPKTPEQGKKNIPLRLSFALWEEIAAWAADDFRSINGQIEYLLTECVKKRNKRFGGDSDAAADHQTRPVPGGSA